MPIELGDNEKILVVAPHPDDESIGCGGILSLYRGHCDVLSVTDGFREDFDNKKMSEIRAQEFIKATDYLDVCNLYCLHIHEQRIRDNKDKFLDVDYNKYKYIFVPNRYEIHKDHADIYKATIRALKKKKCKAEVLEYEVWTTIRFPNVKVDITPVVEEKKNSILMHESQIKDLDYVGMIIGLNAYRGKGHGCDYAEVFYSEKRAKIKKRKDRRKRIKSIIKN